jgi:hypothetical protein
MLREGPNVGPKAVVEVKEEASKKQINYHVE